MAGCPYCKTPVRDDARFCHSCGANLLLPEFDRAFCPQCGARVQSRQWFCQECQFPLDRDLEDDTPLPEILTLEEPGPPALVRPALIPPSPRKNHLLIAGLLATLLVLPLLVWGLLRRPPLTPVSMVAHPVSASPPAAPGQPVVAPASGETPATSAEIDPEMVRRQVALVLDNLRAAQLEKDPVKLLATYAGSFPGLHSKYRNTLAVWEKYDYRTLHYDLGEVALLDSKNLTALVTWELETENRASRQREQASFRYKVWFAQEGGGWRIKNLSPVHRP